MSACDKCMYQPECYEQRDRCASFITLKQYKKERKKDIAMLNQKYQASACAGSDEAAESRGSAGRRRGIESCAERTDDPEGAGRDREQR